jgi:hypothetical protein
METELKQLSVAVGAVTFAQEGIVGLQPRSVPALQFVNTGAFWSITLIGIQHTIVPSSQTTESQRSNEPQEFPALIVTELPLEFVIEAPLVLAPIDQKCVALVQPSTVAEYTLPVEVGQIELSPLK